MGISGTQEVIVSRKGHHMHGRFCLLLARFDTTWEHGDACGLDLFPPHIVITEPFYPRVSHNVITAGDLGEPLDISFNLRDPTYPVVTGKKRLQEYARQLLRNIGEDVRLVEKSVVAGLPRPQINNVLRVAGFELVHTVDAKHRMFEVE